MKGFLKQATIGTALGLAMMVGGIGQAHALLLGETIRTTIEYPTQGVIQVGPDDAVVINPDAELLNYGGIARINFYDTQIRIMSLVNTTFSNVTFNGLHFLDLNGTIDSWVASLNGATTVGGVGLSYDDDNIFVNVANLTVGVGDVILLDVKSAKAVPEPSTMLLLGTGLVGVVGWRYRKTRA